MDFEARRTGRHIGGGGYRLGPDLYQKKSAELIGKGTRYLHDQERSIVVKLFFSRSDKIRGFAHDQFLVAVGNPVLTGGFAIDTEKREFSIYMDTPYRF